MNVSPSGCGTVKVQEAAPDLYPATYTFSNGMTVRLEAVPASAYFFNNWSGDLSSTANPITVVVTSNKSITANFSWIVTTQTRWPLIGGAISGLALVGLAVFVLMFRRRAD